MGKTMSEWDDLDDYDRAWALALDIAEAKDSAQKCESCGGPKDECQNADNQHAYEVSFRRCYRTAAVIAAQKKRTDHEGVLTVVKLNPAKKKSARKKG